MKKAFTLLFSIAFVIILFAQVANAQLTGIKNIPGDYATLAAAITDLNTLGVGSGGVTLNLIASNPQTAPAGGYSITTLTATSDNQIVIQGNGNTITASAFHTAGSQTDAIFKIIGGDYITIQNFVLQENSSNTVTTHASNTMTEFGVALFMFSAANGAQNNIIQNNTISLSAIYQSAIGIFSTSSSSSTNGTMEASSTTGTNSNNKFYGNTISNVAYGLYFICPPITATVFESGIDIGGTSVSTSNTITFGNATTSTLTWNRFSAVLPAGIYFRNGGAGNSVRFNTITSNNLTYAQTGGIGGIVTTGTAATGVTYTSTRSDDIITLYNTGTTAITGIDFAYGLSTGTIAASSNNITLNQSVSVSASSAITGIKANYAFASSTINSNTITTTQGISAGSLTSSVYGINNGSGFSSATQNINSNIITFKQNAPTGTGSFGIGAMYFIYSNTSSAVITSGSINSNQLLTTGSTLRTTGIVYGIYHNFTYTNLTIDGNTINWDRTGSGSTYATYAASGSSVAESITNNSFTLTGSVSGGTTYTVFNEQDGINATSTLKNINGNTININTPSLISAITLFSLEYSYGNINNNNITISTAGSITGSTIGSASPGAWTFDNNTYSFSTSQSSPTITGILLANGSGHTVSNNTFSTISSVAPGTNGPGITVINVTTPTTTNVNNIYGNKIYGLTTGAGSGSASIAGIAVAGGNNNIYKNKIYDLSTSCTGTSTLISDIKISGGTTNNIYNNLIGQTNSFTGVNSTDALRGINITSSTSLSTQNIYYNTIFINASSTGANFGTTGIYHTTNTTATTSALNLRNNIIVNNSAPSGTGLTVAFRRSSSTLTNYASTSNNNDLYATNILHDGTNAYTTMPAYKTLMTPRDAASFSENPTFVSIAGSDPGFLHINSSAPTQIENGGQPISGITDDYDGDERNATTPDVGADEFIVNTASWTGNTSSDWNDHTNWSTYMVPTNSIDVIINSNYLYAPAINNGASASCNNLTIGGGKSLTVANDFTLDVKGNITNNGTITCGNTSTVSLSGISQQNISGNSISFGNLTLNNTSGVLLGNDITINTSLNLTNGNLNTKNGSTLYSVYFTNTSAAFTEANETANNRIVGRVIMNQRNLVGESQLSFLGVTLQGTSESIDFTIDRITDVSESIVSYGIYHGIKCKWHITTAQTPTIERNVTYKWLQVLDNDNDFSSLSAQVWVSNDGNTWTHSGNASLASGDPRSMQVNATTFSYWTVADANNPLPVLLSSFNSNVKDRNVNLSWSTSSEINNSGFEVQKSVVNSKESVDWVKVGYVTGSGTKTTPTNYTFEEKNLNTGKYKYRLKQFDYNGNFEYFNLTGEVEIGVPQKFYISQNYPNPFNPTTKIDFELPYNSIVSIKLYDISGREMMTLLNETKTAGYYTIVMNGNNLSSGMYFYRIIAEGSGQKFVLTKKMLMIK